MRAQQPHLTNPMGQTTSVEDGGSTVARSILVVDDEDTVRQLLVRWLEASGYTVAAACGADEAMTRLAEHPAAVVLCDIRMPGRDGLWLAARIRQHFPDTAVIMATGVQDVGASIESMRQGVVDYLTKPFGRDRLRDAVARGVEWHQGARDARRWRETLERDMDGLKARLYEAMQRLPVTRDQDADAMLALLAGQEARAHGRRVAALTIAVAESLHIPAERLPVLARAALLHDLGKLALPEAVLRKPAPLTPDEQSLVRACPQIAADIAASIDFLASAAPIIRDVHERLDGQGYPRGVRAETVSLEARITSVAEAYDTMTHPRVYRDAITHAEALLEIHRCAGSQFDPAVVRAFTEVIGR